MADDIFSALEDGVSSEFMAMTSSTSSGALQEVVEAPRSKRLKLSVVDQDSAGGNSDEQKLKVSPHITVERNRRKLMNHHLTVLRSLMPCFYVKRGDQASIIGGVVDYITELHKVIESLEAKKKQRKVYSEVLISPRLVSSPRTIPQLSPRKPTPLSPRPSLPMSPKTPQPPVQYSSMLYLSTSLSSSSSPPNSFTTLDSGNELVAKSRSAIAEVEVKLVGGNNLLLMTCSNRICGQATKVIGVLESLSLEVLQVNINIVDEALINSFTIKIGVECQLSAEELAQHIQQTFC